MVFDVSLSVESCTTEAVKSAAVDTWRRYRIALVETFHLNVVMSGRFAALSAGPASVGADGAAAAVVKLLVADHALEPPSFFDRTRQ